MPEARTDAGAAFRALHRPGAPFVLVPAWDAGSARILAALGAPAIEASTAAIRWSLGVTGALEPAVLLARLREIAAAVAVPVAGDALPLSGRSGAAAAAAVRAAAGAGLAGGTLGDSDPEGAGVLDLAVAADRIAAAAAAARALERDFVLAARLDGLGTGAYGLEEAQLRAQAFARAGADVIEVAPPPERAALRRLCAATTQPVAAAVTGASVNLALPELGATGVARVGLDAGLARIALAAVIEAGEAALGGDFTPLGWAARAEAIETLLAKGGP